jgi:hypothetical protein
VTDTQTSLPLTRSEGLKTAQYRFCYTFFGYELLQTKILVVLLFQDFNVNNFPYDLFGFVSSLPAVSQSDVASGGSQRLWMAVLRPACPRLGR